MISHDGPPCLLSSKTVTVDAKSLEHAGDFELATCFYDLDIELVVHESRYKPRVCLFEVLERHSPRLNKLALKELEVVLQ